MTEATSPSSPAALFAFPAPRPAAGAQHSGLALSIVVPMFNEEGGAAALVAEIASALAAIDHEIIVVDDASSDATRERLLAMRATHKQLRVIAHAANAGQSRAVRTGVLAARAPAVATLDGDGQNDPADIPALFRQLTREGAPEALAMVAGERRERKDAASKKWASRFANSVRARLLKDGAADTGCGLKLFAREAFMRLPAFDHMHRYLPALMAREGFVVEFAPVGHRPRAHGRSKYTNLGRLAVAFRDLLGLMWLNDRARDPKSICEL